MMKSLRELFAQRLEDERIKVVSFDLFDTLLYRKTHDPKNVFLKLGENLPEHKNFFQQRSYKEHIARAKAASEDISLQEIYSEFVDESEIKRYVELELQTEAALLYANKEMDVWIRLASEYRKRIIVVSDTYFAKEELFLLMRSKIQNFSLIDAVYTSADTGVLKASSNLFGHLLQAEKIDAADILHVGDNIVSDSVMAKKWNIETLYVGRSMNTAKCHRIEKEFLSKDIAVQALRDHAAIFPVKPTENPTQAMFEIGAYLFGPVLYNFCVWVLEYAYERGLKQINLLMREGRIFQKYIALLQAQNKRYAIVQVNTVYASRAALYMPFLHDDVLESSNLIYSKMTIGEYYKLHRIAIKEDKIQRYALTTVEKAHKIIENRQSLYDRVHQDFYARKDEIALQSRLQADLFLEYLEQIGYCPNSVFVDFGGGGTILGQIAALLGKNQAKANLLFFKKEAAFHKKIDLDAFIPYTRSNRYINEAILRYAPVVEALLNGACATTLAYERKESGVVPTLGSSVAFTPEFDRGVLAFFETLKEFEWEHGVGLDERTYCAEILYRFLVMPTKEEAEAIGMLVFERDVSGSYQSRFLDVADKNFDLQRYFTTLCNYQDARKVLGCQWPHGQVALQDEQLLQKKENIYVPQSAFERYAVSILKEVLTKNIGSLSIYGGGDIFIALYKEILLGRLDLHINSVIMTVPPTKREYFGFPVVTPQEALQNGEKNIIIASFSFQKEMLCTLQEIAARTKQQVRIFYDEDEEKYFA
jgi:FMN phosphatase YigB (HAD superfamily)